MDNSAPEKPALYFDGSCRLCRSFAARISQQAGERLLCLDLETARLPAAIDSARARREIQLLKSDGKVISGLDALLEIYRLLGRRSLLITLAGMPGIKLLLRSFYRFIAAYRHYLPAGDKQRTQNHKTDYNAKN